MLSTLEAYKTSGNSSFTLVAPQILDNQLCNLISLQKPSAQEVHAQLSLLLLLFPSLLVNSGYIEENDFFDELTNNELRNVLSSGAIVLATGADIRPGHNVTWEALEEATLKRTQGAPPELRKDALQRLHRIRDLSAKVYFINVDAGPLGDSFKKRIERLSLVLKTTSTPDHLIPGLSAFCGREAIMDAERGLHYLAKTQQLTRRIAYNVFDFENAMKNRTMPSAQRLIKAAVDSCYISTVPSSLGASTCYSKTNRAYEIASLGLSLEKDEKQLSTTRLLSSARVSIRAPERLSDAIALRLQKAAVMGDPPPAVTAFQDWWELFVKRCHDFKLNLDPTSKVGMTVVVDRITVSSVRIKSDSRADPLQLNIATATGIEDSYSPRDLQELRSRTSGNTVWSKS